MKQIKEVTATQLAYLLGKPVESCARMVAHCHGIKVGTTEKLPDGAPSVTTVGMFEKHYSHYPIKESIASIQNDYLKKGSTREWIMNLPAREIERSKTPRRKISIPRVIKSFLSEEQVAEILHEWNERYDYMGVQFC